MSEVPQVEVPQVVVRGLVERPGAYSFDDIRRFLGDDQTSVAGESLEGTYAEVRSECLPMAAIMRAVGVSAEAEWALIECPGGGPRRIPRAQLEAEAMLALVPGDGSTGTGQASVGLLVRSAEGRTQVEQLRRIDFGCGPAVEAAPQGESWSAAELEEAIRARPAYAFAKRALDVTVSAGLIVFLAPLLGTIAVLIKLTSPGPVLFRQERCGLGGRPFLMTKFRTMVPDAPRLVEELAARARQGEIAAVDAPAFKSKDDPRVTRVGKYLRRFSLDELPQLFDVLAGSMSLVGPRPLVAAETQALSEAERVRHLVKPGLTCLWQTSRRSRVSYQERMAMDIEYTRRMSLWLDLALLARTPFAVFRGDGAF